MYVYVIYKYIILLYITICIDLYTFTYNKDADIHTLMHTYK